MMGAEPVPGCTNPEESAGALRRFLSDFAWQGVPVLAYKEEGSRERFAGVTRQVLFEGDQRLSCQLRYFEIAPGGHSTLERHDHLHVVVVVRGAGHALIGHRVVELALFDVARIASREWHQFRATSGEAFGFLCLVAVERDRPERPDAAAIEELRALPHVAAFIRV
jgi:quercetin dioxygenase-like cupin family protein